MSLLPLLFMVAFAILEGHAQGIVYHSIKPRNSKVNEHISYTIQRAMVLILIGIWMLYMHWTPHIAGVGVFFMGLSYAFFHAGSMYYTRKQLSQGKVYPDGWWSEPSATGTNRMSLSCDARSILAIIGVIGYGICAHLNNISH